MRNAFFLLAFLFTATFSLRAQHLDFIGLKGISFGMAGSKMTDRTVIIDSTSAYKDTATYLRNTRCRLYFRKAENFQMTGFTASKIEYEFCDDQLSYVFVYVNGETEINNAIATLQKTFHHLGCGKNIPPAQCRTIDASAKGMRLIINIDQQKHTMNFVLIPKKAAK